MLWLKAMKMVIYGIAPHIRQPLGHRPGRSTKVGDNLSHLSPAGDCGAWNFDTFSRSIRLRGANIQSG